MIFVKFFELFIAYNVDSDNLRTALQALKFKITLRSTEELDNLFILLVFDQSINQNELRPFGIDCKFGEQAVAQFAVHDVLIAPIYDDSINGLTLDIIVEAVEIVDNIGNVEHPLVLEVSGVGALVPVVVVQQNCGLAEPVIDKGSQH